ncbi:unnamed protein product [Victoria cruziana]
MARAKRREEHAIGQMEIQAAPKDASQDEIQVVPEEAAEELQPGQAASLPLPQTEETSQPEDEPAGPQQPAAIVEVMDQHEAVFEEQKEPRPSNQLVHTLGRVWSKGDGSDTGLPETRTSQPPLAGHQPGQGQAKAAATRSTATEAPHRPALEANPGLVESPAQLPRASPPGKALPTTAEPRHQGTITSKGPSPSSHRLFPKEEAGQDLTTLACLSPTKAKLAQQELGPSMPRQQPPASAQPDLPHSPA